MYFVLYPRLPYYEKINMYWVNEINKPGFIGAVSWLSAVSTSAFMVSWSKWQLMIGHWIGFGYHVFENWGLRMLNLECYGLWELWSRKSGLYKLYLIIIKSWMSSISIIFSFMCLAISIMWLIFPKVMLMLWEFCFTGRNFRPKYRSN